MPDLNTITPIIDNAMLLLRPGMDTPEARVMLLAIGLQESRFEYRRQLGNGPARGFWQFELGTYQSRGGVWGVYLHPASRALLRDVCASRRVLCEPAAIWRVLEDDDVLAAAVARLLLVTDPLRLPAVTATQAGWDLYARTWRPGRPHPETWPKFHAAAQREVTVGHHV